MADFAEWEDEASAGEVHGIYCAKRLFPPRMSQIGLFVRPSVVRKVITFWGREMSVPDGHTSPLKIKVRISVFEKNSQ